MLTYYAYTSNVWLVVYSYLVLREIGQHFRRIGNYLSDIEAQRLRWIRFIVWSLLVYVLILHIIQLLKSPLGYQLVNFMSAALNVSVLLYTAISGIKQFALDFPERTPPEEYPQEEEEQEKATTLESANTKRDSSSKEAEARSPIMAANYDRLLKIMVEERPYLDSKLTIVDLAKKLRLGSRTTSRLINAYSGTNFNKFVNKYRVNRAKELLEDPAFSHLSMEGVAREAGFNSRGTFYKIFKADTNLSPARYLSKKNRNSSN